MGGPSVSDNKSSDRPISSPSNHNTGSSSNHNSTSLSANNANKALNEWGESLRKANIAAFSLRNELLGLDHNFVLLRAGSAVLGKLTNLSDANLQLISLKLKIYRDYGYITGIDPNIEFKMSEIEKIGLNEQKYRRLPGLLVGTGENVKTHNYNEVKRTIDRQLAYSNQIRELSDQIYKLSVENLKRARPEKVDLVKVAVKLVDMGCRVSQNECKKFTF